MGPQIFCKFQRFLPNFFSAIFVPIIDDKFPQFIGGVKQVLKGGGDTLVCDKDVLLGSRIVATLCIEHNFGYLACGRARSQGRTVMLALI